MRGLFSLTPLGSTAAEEAAFTVRLDPQEPYLDDHRPGGDPLLSTVMAIEASVLGARVFAAREVQAWVSQIKVHEPFILSGAEPPLIRLSIIRSGNAAAPHFQCSLSSTRGGRSVTHLEAHVHLDSAGLSAAAQATEKVAAPRIQPSAAAVDGARVYELFFHGPSYQVIGAAQFQSGQMVCELKQGLPPSHSVADLTSEMAPRIIEFALQTAGLLEIATNGRMMIPHSIESIQRLRPVDVSPHAKLIARASYGPANESCIKVEIFDDTGQRVLVVDGYRTVVLPFPIPADAVARLTAQLRG